MIAKQAMKWTADMLRRGDRHIDEPRNTWKRDLEKEMKATSSKYNWKKM